MRGFCRPVFRSRFVQNVCGFDCRVRFKLDLQLGVAEQRRVFIHKPGRGQFAIGGVEFHADAVSPVLQRRHHGCRRAAERIKHGVTGEGEHLDQPGSEFKGERGRVFLGRGAGDRPELLEPLVEVVLGNHALAALFLSGLPVTARLALHENEFNVVLDDGVRLIGFAEELGAVAHLVIGVGNLVPDDRIEVVKTKFAALHADVGMERNDGVSPIILAPGEADVTHHADEASSGDEHAERLRPHELKFAEELFVFLDVAQLALGLVVALEGPVRGRGDDEMDGFIGYEGEIACVALHEAMHGRNLVNGGLSGDGVLHRCLMRPENAATWATSEFANC